MGNLQNVFGGDGFNANNVDPAKDMGPIPTGKYAAIIEDSQIVNVKDFATTGGQYLECVHQVISGPCKGRKVWARLNLVNKNPTAKKIADSQFSAICHATGVLTPSDSAELHNIPMLIRVEFQEPNYDAQKNPKGSKKPSNEIKCWEKLPDDFDPEAVQEAATTRAAAPAASAAPSAPGVAKTPAWKRGKAAAEAEAEATGETAEAAE
jgi:hypothetical protein